MTLPIGTHVRSKRNGAEGDIIGYSALAWPTSADVGGDGGIMQPVYLVQVAPGSSSLCSACIVLRADQVEEA
jgi:hypothetical protein